MVSPLGPRPPPAALGGALVFKPLMYKRTFGRGWGKTAPLFSGSVDRKNEFDCLSPAKDSRPYLRTTPTIAGHDFWSYGRSFALARRRMRRGWSSSSTESGIAAPVMR